jgi:molecular chaperone GrpE (heat shock protein)
MALAESYFHLEAALAHTEIGAEILEALALIREKLDDVCFEADLEIIRESGVPFDSRRHEALDRAPDGEPPVVRSVTAPGFMHNGRVLRAARVMLTEESNISDQSESEEFYGE